MDLMEKFGKHKKNELSERSCWKEIKRWYKQKWRAIGMAWIFGFAVWAILPCTYKTMLKMMPSWIILISGIIYMSFYFNMVKGAKNVR